MWGRKRVACTQLVFASRANETGLKASWLASGVSGRGGFTQILSSYHHRHHSLVMRQPYHCICSLSSIFVLFDVPSSAGKRCFLSNFFAENRFVIN
jgi:hypothetical protein